MPQGTVIHWSDDKGYGFIRPDAGGGDLFFHVRELADGVEPKRGARVEFDEGYSQRNGKLEAKKVKIILRQAAP